MALAVRLELSKNLPFRTEHKLINERGFYVYQRTPTTVILAKNDGWVPYSKRKESITDPLQLPEEVTNELAKRCNKILDFYLDWESNLPTVKQRLENLARTLPTIEGEWVRNWTFNNVN